MTKNQAKANALADGLSHKAIKRAKAWARRTATEWHKMNREDCMGPAAAHSFMVETGLDMMEEARKGEGRNSYRRFRRFVFGMMIAADL